MSIYQLGEDYYNDFTTRQKLEQVYREQFKKELQYCVHIEEQMAHTIKTVIQIIYKVDEKEITEKSKLVSDIKVYVETHLSDSTLDIESISENSNFSYHYVCKVFKKKTGITLGNYILEKRMERAKKLILDGLESVDLLAEQVGYTDSNYFRKAFKKYFDISPSKLIRGAKGGHK
jgi:AraC-like DNA-binding protein